MDLRFVSGRWKKGRFTGTLCSAPAGKLFKNVWSISFHQLETEWWSTSTNENLGTKSVLLLLQNVFDAGYLAVAGSSNRLLGGSRLSL
jgi:hypothetical protein